MSCKNPGCNNPEGSDIYLLDNNGVPMKCTNSDSDKEKYICSRTVFGKRPVYTASDDLDKCGFSLCDVNIFTGETKLDSCRNVDFPYYLDGKKCNMINSKCTDDLDITVDCCDGQREVCKDGEKELPPSYYISAGDYQGTKPFTCNGNQCIPVPPDFDIGMPSKSKDKYPEIYNSVMDSQSKYGGLGVFYSNNCNCVQDRNDCKNNSICKPVYGCKACKFVGKYYCDQASQKCSPTTDNNLGTYNDLVSCETDCKNIKKYSCTNGKCIEDPQGQYIGMQTCLDNCRALNATSFNTKNLLKIFTISGVVILGTIFIIFLLVLIIKIIQKIQRNRK